MPRIAENDTLPPTLWIRWTLRRKRTVVLAVSSGRLTVSDAMRRYKISKDEYLDWERAVGAICGGRGQDSGNH